MDVAFNKVLYYVKFVTLLFTIVLTLGTSNAIII